MTRNFDRLAPEWEETRVSPQHLLPLQSALDQISPPRRVLDVGTGTGAAARLVAARWPQAEVVGVDLSAEMVNQATARAGSDRETYLRADASALPFEDDEFDLVLLVNMIPFYDELARVTASEGTVVLVFSRGMQTPIYVPFDRLRAELEQRGFAHIADTAAGAGIGMLARKSGRP
jgi:ubiquinone/menaquinone biosynthesis C-methylase UbiE